MPVFKTLYLTWKHTFLLHLMKDNSLALLPKQPATQLGWPLPSFLLDNPAPTYNGEVYSLRPSDWHQKSPKGEPWWPLQKLEAQLFPLPFSPVLTDSERLTCSGILENIWSTFTCCACLCHNSQVITRFLPELVQEEELITSHQPTPELSHSK